MSCLTSGRTYLNSLVPFPNSSENSASYLANLTHYTCGGRRICSLDSFPLSADLSYKVLGVEEVGNGLYNATVLATGTCSFMPYASNVPRGSCPATEPIFAYLSVPVTTADASELSLTAGECACSLNGISCNCNTSSSINISCAFTVAQSA